MKNIKKKLFVITTMALMAIPTIAFAKDLEGGELNWHGGQTDKIVYSDIRDVNTSNNKRYMVHASVKVGGEITRSGWQEDSAYAEADRVWYANESSYYDYYKR